MECDDEKNETVDPRLSKTKKQKLLMREGFEMKASTIF